MVQPLWRTAWRFLRTLKTELSYDPTIILQDIYLKKTIILKDTCIPLFIVALFTIIRTWKQPKCLLMDEWIKMWSLYTHTHTHTHTHTYYNGVLLSHKKSKMMPFAMTWIDLEIVILSGHKSDKGEYRILLTREIQKWYK